MRDYIFAIAWALAWAVPVYRFRHGSTRFERRHAALVAGLLGFALGVAIGFDRFAALVMG